MNGGRRAGRPHRFAQESGLFSIAFNEMDFCPGHACNYTGNRDARKTAARSEINPNFGLRDQRWKLERISDVARPQFTQRRRGNEIDSALPAQQGNQ